jgi:hypothetical protein
MIELHQVRPMSRKSVDPIFQNTTWLRRISGRCASARATKALTLPPDEADWLDEWAEVCALAKGVPVPTIDPVAARAALERIAGVEVALRKRDNKATSRDINQPDQGRENPLI